MQFDWLFLLVFCCSLLGTLVSVIVIAINRDMPFPARVLSLMLLCISLSLFHNGLLTSRQMLKVPFLFQSAAFLSLCIAPLLFIYVRAVLTQQWRLPKTDLIFLIVAVLYTLKFIPVYILGHDEKLALVRKALETRDSLINEEGSWLPGPWGLSFRFLYGFALTLASGWMVIAWYRRTKGRFIKGSHNMGVFQWLSFLITVLFLGYVIMMFEFFLHVSWKPNLVSWMTTTICIAILSICIYLFFKPEILYGFRHYVLEDGLREEDPAVQEINDPSTSRNSLTRSQEEAMRRVLEDHLKTNKPFLKQGYAVRDLSVETGYPTYMISLFINQEYEKNFNEFVNEYRVNHLLGLVSDGSLDLNQYTLEGLGRIGGFNSRAAFISAVKRQYNKTPAQLFGRKSFRHRTDHSVPADGEG